MKREAKNKFLARVVGPTVVEFDIHDLIQIIIGASIIAVPIIFSQQSWNFVDVLPLLNTFIVLGLTVFFIAIFTYFHYHKENLRANPRYHIGKLIKRVVGTYVLSFIIVAIILSVIQVISLNAELISSFKRIVVITFPSAMGAAISDKIK